MATDSGDELADRLQTFRTHGIRRRSDDDPMRGGWHYEIDTLGFNYRITDFQCALGDSQLSRLDHYIERRNEVAAWYRRAARRYLWGHAPGARPRVGIVTPTTSSSCGSQRGLGAAGMRTSRSSAPGSGPRSTTSRFPRTPAYQGLGYSMTSLPHAQAYWEQALTLPLFPAMTYQDAERVTTELRLASWLRRRCHEAGVVAARQDS